MKKLNAFHLKLIAIIAMLINHIGHTFEAYWTSPIWVFLYLAIGLLTFPIMAYLVVEGFFYTKNRWRYAGRLGIFSLISFVPFHFLFHPPFPLWPGNNIMFTLMMGVVMMMLLERFPKVSLQFLLLFLFIGLTIWSDWQFFGIPIIFTFYKCRENKQKFWLIPLISLLMLLLNLSVYGAYLSIPVIFATVFSNLGILLVLPILSTYNGYRGYSPNWVKWGFYIFYPLHLVLLLGLRWLLLGS
ncbi:TraX family protein [Streptococcus plurextorum]|uniref:TraX family protein n=1 Tax=Streptococcus plurextorum TaxID=456876 RepID=UPI0004028B47|nr:TraX family protein [Streptococcus plurextorum]